MGCSVLSDVALPCFSGHIHTRGVNTRFIHRDFTNPYLPTEGVVQPMQGSGMGAAAVAAAGGQGAGMQQQQQQFGVGLSGLSKSNVLLVYIDDVEYTPTLEALHTVFKTYGQVQRMTVFEKSGNWQVCGCVCRGR